MATYNGEKAGDIALRLYRSGRNAINHARARIGGSGPSPEAQAELRESFKTLRSAMNWAEEDDDLTLFDQAHRLLDQTGRFVRQTFGCTLAFDDDVYHQRCPVALAHNRMGTSPAFEYKLTCSICESDPENCVHIEGQNYDGIECLYVAHPVALIELSIVNRPRFPDNRFESVSIDYGTLRGSLGNDWEPGIDINCDFCLHPCRGVFRPPTETEVKVREVIPPVE